MAAFKVLFMILCFLQVSYNYTKSCMQKHQVSKEGKQFPARKQYILFKKSH